MQISVRIFLCINEHRDEPLLYNLCDWMSGIFDFRSYLQNQCGWEHTHRVKIIGTNTQSLDHRYTQPEYRSYVHTLSLDHRYTNRVYIIDTHTEFRS